MAIHCRLHPATDHVLSLLVGSPSAPASPGSPSIVRILESRLARWRAGDRSALDPDPVLDRALHQLVELLLAPASAVGCSRDDDGPVAAEVADRLDGDPLRPLADTVREASGLAEAAMEHHFARLLLGRWPAAEPASRPPHRPGATASDRAGVVARLCHLLGPFPYVENYVHLVEAELQAVAACHRPVGSVAVCGAGPLPLTGLLIHARLGCPVTLIDQDREAAHRSSALVLALERLGVVEPGAVSTVARPAERTPLEHHDVVLVAALVPQPALLTVVDRLARRRPASRAVTVLARSARGLVARLAYRPLDPGPVVARGLRHLGTVVPANAAGTSAPGPADPPLSVAHHEVLNCTEVFALP